MPLPCSLKTAQRSFDLHKMEISKTFEEIMISTVHEDMKLFRKLTGSGD